MRVSKQFCEVDAGISRLLSNEDKFVPEMSLPIDTILNQFSYVDSVRMVDMARQGFEHANNDENDFDVEDFDRLDPAEKDEVYQNAAEIVRLYEEQMKRQKEKTEDKTDPPEVDESVLP